jgi:hypothetical protein
MGTLHPLGRRTIKKSKDSKREKKIKIKTLRPRGPGTKWKDVNPIK